MDDRIEERPLHLFEGYGVELEYMIVDRDTLDIKPICDWLLYEAAGTQTSEVDRGQIAWSNELVLHLVELKTNGPAPGLANLHERFQHEVEEINRILAACNAMLMPTAMHPWMNPDLEMALWPHEYNPIYEAYNRIFDCRGHGWANLQSVHFNLPFANDEEFEKLHAAIRVLLPLLPGLAASSPIADLQKQSHADYRLEVYRTNSERIPSVTGRIVPEAVFSERAYNDQIFQRMYRDIDPYDSEKLLQEEWLNSRGAIARFDRGSIEIRILDIQDCPLSDFAVLRMISDVLKALVAERWGSLDEQKSWHEETLFQILMNVARNAEASSIETPDYLALFGIEVSEPRSFSVSHIWQHLFNELYSAEAVGNDEILKCVQRILSSGTLSTRINRAVPDGYGKTEIAAVYRKLCECLNKGEFFTSDE